MRIPIFSFFALCLLFLQANIVQSVAKRETNDEWYTVKKRDLCPNIQKAFFCPGLFSINEVTEGLRRFREEDLNDLSRKFKTPFGDYFRYANYSVECSKPIQEALCSETRPLCLEDNKADNPEARKICQKIYDNCPYLAKERKLERYVDFCEKYLLREYSDMTCERIGSDFPNGGCIKPTRKVPSFYIPLYAAKAEKVEKVYDLMEKVNKAVRIFSPECLRTIQQTMCLPITCSDTDDSVVLVKNKMEGCKEAMECVNEAIDDVMPSYLSTLVKPTLDKIKEMISKSCETAVDTVKEIANKIEASKKKTSSSETLLPTGLLFLLAFCFKFFVN